MGFLIAIYLAVALLVFVGCVLLLDDVSITRDRKIIGWVGLAAPIWPVTAVVAVILFFISTAKSMIQAARGK